MGETSSSPGHTKCPCPGAPSCQPDLLLFFTDTGRAITPVMGHATEVQDESLRLVDLPEYAGEEGYDVPTVKGGPVRGAGATTAAPVSTSVVFSHFWPCRPVTSSMSGCQQVVEQLNHIGPTPWTSANLPASAARIKQVGDGFEKRNERCRVAFGNLRSSSSSTSARKGFLGCVRGMSATAAATLVPTLPRSVIHYSEQNVQWVGGPALMCSIQSSTNAVFSSAGAPATDGQFGAPYVRPQPPQPRVGVWVWPLHPHHDSAMRGGAKPLLTPRPL